MKPNLSIIAKESGYSVPTVSRVLSGKVKGWSKSVDIILKAAKKMGYNYVIPLYPNSIVLPKVVLMSIMQKNSIHAFTRAVIVLRARKIWTLIFYPSDTTRILLVQLNMHRIPLTALF